MTRYEAGERILEISEEMQELLREAMGLINAHGTNLDYQRAQSYWYAHIMIALGGDHGYMARSMASMIGTAEDLMEGEETEESEESEEGDSEVG